MNTKKQKLKTRSSEIGVSSFRQQCFNNRSWTYLGIKKALENLLSVSVSPAMAWQRFITNLNLATQTEAATNRWETLIQILKLQQAIEKMKCWRHAQMRWWRTSYKILKTSSPSSLHKKMLKKLFYYVCNRIPLLLTQKENHGDGVAWSLLPGCYTNSSSDL